MPSHNRRTIKKSRPHLWLKRKRFLSLVLSLLGVSLGVGYKHLSHNSKTPEAVVVLGGHEDRERYAARIAQENPTLQVWVSSGSPEGYVRKIFKKAGIGGDRVHLDYSAQDTVTNFTTLVHQLKAKKIDSVYVVTSENHMSRALIIGEIVFGSQGIAIKPVVVPCEGPPEPVQKGVRDGIRSLLWLFTGTTVGRSK